MGKTCAEKKLINCTCDVCELGSGGCAIFLPALGESEQEWPNGLRVVLYLLGLLWAFMGVAIVADVFMGAIERITSKKKRVFSAKAGKMVTLQVWNDTVANLTLMALGSSAPEILLSLIELMANEFYSGSLGPSTIVGSAAFNLFMISAVCVSAIPAGQSRTIKEFCVFRITAFFSVFAYIWLLIIVSWITPDVVDIWEGLVTFLYFPVLVFIAYLADIGYFSCEAKEEDDEEKPPDKPVRMSVADMTKDELASMEASVRKKNQTVAGAQSLQLTDEQMATLVQFELSEPKSRAAYRVGATRKLFAGRKVSMAMAMSGPRPSQVVPEEGIEEEVDDDPRIPVTFEFGAAGYAVMENIGVLKVPVRVHCEGKKKFQKVVSVNYKSRDGTASQGDDYTPVEGTLEFKPGDKEKNIEVTIIDDAAYEADEYFFLDLSKPQCGETGYKAVLGDNATCQIAIIDDDHPGVFSFEQECIEVQEEIDNTKVACSVIRKGGANGEVSCIYHTEDDSAIAGKDYVKMEPQALHFNHGQVSANIELTIKPVGRYEVSEQFRLVLTQPKGGARFDPKTDGGETSNICTIIINPNGDTQKRTDALMSTLMGNYDKAQIGHANWKDQFKDAIFVNGGDSDEAPSIPDIVLHGITVFWKVLFALIPPVDFCDGWLCFVCSLAMIGLVTAFIGELASLLGCTMGMPDAITAITFVALGTSLPDTFASKTAAEQDPFADASIGNVTGSNSVNVFLGLGLPWFLGAIYWAIAGKKDEWVQKYQDKDVFKEYPDGGKFVVLGGDLGFSVIVFSTCAIICISVFMLRRVWYKAELGGPVLLKYCTSAGFACLWFIYVGLSSWKVVQTRGEDKCYQ